MPTLTTDVQRTEGCHLWHGQTRQVQNLIFGIVKNIWPLGLHHGKFSRNCRVLQPVRRKRGRRRQRMMTWRKGHPFPSPIRRHVTERRRRVERSINSGTRMTTRMLMWKHHWHRPITWSSSSFKGKLISEEELMNLTSIEEEYQHKKQSNMQ